jgi:hypothetical protein
MSLSQCPHLTATTAHQRQHEPRREATQWHAATRAAASATPHQGMVSQRHAGSASRPAVSWRTRVACWLRVPLPARPTPVAEAGSHG